MITIFIISFSKQWGGKEDNLEEIHKKSFNPLSCSMPPIQWSQVSIDLRQ